MQCSKRLLLSARPGLWAELFCSFSRSAHFRFERIKFLASGRSAGKRIEFAGQEHKVEELTPDCFADVDLAIGSTPDEVARDFVPWAIDRGCVVVDESGYWRMKPDVPLVIPEVNPEAAFKHKGLIASPNCSTTQMVVAIKPLHDAGPSAPRRRQHLSGHERRGLGGQPRAGVRHSRSACRQGALAYETFAASDRVQSDSADRLTEARGLHVGRNEDGL